MNDQPRFDGPGIYSLVPYVKPSCELNSWGGSTKPGEPIKLYDLASSKNKFTDNERWQFSLASGSGSSAKYLLFNVRNGYYLSVDDSGTGLASLAQTPTSDKVLWSIVDASSESNGYHVFYVKGANGQISCPDGFTQGTAVKYENASSADYAKFYIVTRAP